MNNDTPRISVIVPVYNGGAYLAAALDSVLAATRDGDEILLVNDGSTDDSGLVVRAYGQRHPQRIRVLEQENRGYGAACNRGLRLATGKYVAVFEPDDWIEADFYHRLFHLAETWNVDMVRADGFFAFEEGSGAETVCTRRFARQAGRRLERNFSGLFWLQSASIWNALYRRTMVRDFDIRFMEGAGASFQDVQFWISVHSAVRSLAIAPEPGYHYRQHPQQSIRNADAKVEAIIHNWRSELAWLRERKCADLSFFMNRTFRQFVTLCKKQIALPENRARLLAAIRDLACETGVRRLDFPGMRVRDRISYRFLGCFRCVRAVLDVPFDIYTAFSAPRR